MAPAAQNVLKKTVFRCLDVLRTVVAAAMTVLMAVVIVSAVKVVHRPDDLTIWVVAGIVDVQRSGNLTVQFNQSAVGHNLTFRYTVRAVNPSRSVRFYYTRPIARLRGRNSSSVMNGFVALSIPSMDVKHQSEFHIFVAKSIHSRADRFPFLRYYYEALANGRSITDASLVLNGTRIVQNIYTGRNISDEQAVYYCSPITFCGVGDADVDACSSGGAVDTACTEDAPTSVLMEEF